MSQQKHWFPGQPDHRKIFDFTQSSLDIKDMPAAFISQDELFMGNTYESDNEEEQYYIIGRNLVDGFYKVLPGTENLFENTPFDPANCFFTQGTRQYETCALFFARGNALVKVGLNRGQIVSTENIDIPLPVAVFSPVVSFMVMDKLILGYVYQSHAGSGECTLVFLRYENGISSLHHLVPFYTESAPVKCYVHINKNQYALHISTQESATTNIHIGEIDRDGKFSAFSHTFNSSTTFISAAFSQDNEYLFYPDREGNSNFISSLRLADNSITRTPVVEDYNMLKLAPDGKIYGLNKYIVNKDQSNFRLYAAIEILPEGTVEINEFISLINGGYFPAEPFHTLFSL